MLVRAIQFLVGALLGAGGGYLVWTYRASLASPLFPPGPEGLPWIAIAGIAAGTAGIVFLATAVIPRPKRAAAKAAAAAAKKAKLEAADTYYSDRNHAADRDWRSGDLPPQPKPQAPEPEPLLKSAPPPEPLLKPLAPPPPMEPLLKPVEAAPLMAPEFAPSKPSASKPVATSIPPAAEPSPFPSAATLAPIPKSSDPPPSPQGQSPAHQQPQLQVVSPAGGAAGFDSIRAAIADGRLDDADKLLSAQRDKVQGEALAELTGLAGDHAAAAGRLSNAKWLWRLALKRFGESNAMNSPAARAVSERLRLAGN